MKKWLKKYFIPHEHNDYEPHILRHRVIFLLLGVIIFAEFVFLAQVFVIFPEIKLYGEILRSVLTEETNSNRLAGNVPTLKINSLLTEAAQEKANDMAQKSYFAHTSPEGITPWYWIDKVGYQYIYAGENLAINFSDSKDVVDAWMNSPSHRSNILNGNYTEMGLGVAKGVYQNRETIFIAQMFGQPIQEVTVAVAVPTTPKLITPKPVALKPSPTSTVSDKNIVTSTEQVSGEQVSDEQQQTFVAVENTGEGEPEVLPIETSNIKLENKRDVSISTFFAEIITSPKMRTQYLYLIIAIFISFALILNVLIKPRVQRPRIIINGIVLILIINTALFINNYLLLTNGKIF